MNPNELNKIVEDRFKDITEMESYFNENLIKTLIKKMYTETLGVEFDAWGNVEKVENYKFYDSIKEQCKDEIEEYRVLLQAKIQKSLLRKNIPILSQTKINRLMDEIQHEIINEELEKIKPTLQQMAKDQIKNTLAPWYAMQRIEK